MSPRPDRIVRTLGRRYDLGESVEDQYRLVDDKEVARDGTLITVEIGPRFEIRLPARCPIRVLEVNDESPSVMIWFVLRRPSTTPSTVAFSNPGDGAISWAREFHQALEPYAAEGVYVNYLSGDESERVSEAYGDRYDRLRDLKTEWDPENLFRTNQNIGPAN